MPLNETCLKSYQKTHIQAQLFFFYNLQKSWGNNIETKLFEHLLQNQKVNWK